MPREPGVTSPIRVTVDAAEAELAADALWAAGPSAVHEEALADGRVQLTADPCAPVDPRWDPVALPLDGDEYLDAWRAWARPIRVGRVVLQPPWAERMEPATDDVAVLLDPGRAFGSGSHPSTQLALAALQQALRPGDRVLDVGSGSGVLAVAAVLLGAASATALDLAPAALAATRATAEANGVADRMVISDAAPADVNDRFELVVANIGAGALVELAAGIGARTAPGGRVVLAGFLSDRADEVAMAYARFDELERLDADGWSALVLT